MKSFRKKPVVVQAVQFDGTYENAIEISELIGVDSYASMERSPNGIARINIKTLEGRIYAIKDDWIIRGTQGEFYPCKPAPFADTFEEVKE
jgi:hypothetical protein